MPREMTDEEAEALADLMHKHVMQIDQGLIPPDAPFDFVRPEGDAALVDGKPWWFGPDYKPTLEAINSFLFTDPTKAISGE